MRKMLIKWLEDHDCTALELAELSGVSKSTIYNILNGTANERKVGVAQVIKISNAIGISVEELYGEPPVPEPTPETVVLTSEERDLLDAWNHATDAAKESALMVLKCNPAPVVKKGTAI